MASVFCVCFIMDVSAFDSIIASVSPFVTFSFCFTYTFSKVPDAVAERSTLFTGSIVPVASIVSPMAARDTAPTV